MKKLFTLVLILCLVLPCAFAENVKELTDDELIELNKAVQAEMIERGLWGANILPAGVYRVGKPLPEGSYECIMRVTKDYGFVWIYKSYEDYKNNKSSGLLTLTDGQEFMLSLYDDVVYKIDQDAYVRPFTGFNW